MPTFWVAMLFIYLFGYRLRILPILGMHTVGVKTLGDFFLHFIMPYVVLTLAFIPDNVRYVRSSTITQYSEDYVMVQKAFGASRTEIMFKHVCKKCIASGYHKTWYGSAYSGNRCSNYRNRI